MKKQQNKRTSLFLPVLCTYLVLLAACLVYGGTRYLLLAKEEGIGTFQIEVLYRVLWEVLPALTVLLIFGVMLLVYLRTAVSGPAKRLLRCAGGIAERLGSGKKPVAVEARGTLGALSRTLAGQERSVAALIHETELAASQSAEKRVRAELARELQLSQTPEKTDLVGLTYGLSAAARFSPEVGADFYDGFAIDRDRVLIAAGDVWGTGLPAVQFAGKLKSALRERAIGARSLGDVLAKLNELFLSSDPNPLAATLFVGIFDSASGELRFADAGHPAPILTGVKPAALPLRPGAPIGLYPNAVYREEICMLQPGQGIFLYTDGLVNARSKAKERFGAARLLGKLEELYARALSAEFITDGVVQAAEEFCKDTERADDFVALTLLYATGVQRLFKPDLGEIASMRELLYGWLGDDPRAKKMCLACEEIFTNIVNHAGAKTIQLSYEREESGLVLRFTDDGKPFDPLKPSAEKDFYSYAEGGMGLNIIRAIAGEIFYRTKQNLNVLTLRFPVIRGL